MLTLGKFEKIVTLQAVEIEWMEVLMNGWKARYVKWIDYWMDGYGWMDGWNRMANEWMKRKEKWMKTLQMNKWINLWFTK